MPFPNTRPNTSPKLVFSDLVGHFAVVQSSPVQRAYRSDSTDEVLQLLTSPDGLALPLEVLVQIANPDNWIHSNDHPFFMFTYQKGFTFVQVFQLHQVPTL